MIEPLYLLGLTRAYGSHARPASPPAAALLARLRARVTMPARPEGAAPATALPGAAPLHPDSCPYPPLPSCDVLGEAFITLPWLMRGDRR
jgi:hypothetical protein